MSGGERCRLDVWLWRARFFKTRTLAAAAVEGGGIYLERQGQGRSLEKPATAVQPGDGLSFRKGAAVRTVRVLALGTRRGPPAEARGLYTEIEGAVDGSTLDGWNGADHFDGAPEEPDPR